MELLCAVTVGNCDPQIKFKEGFFPLLRAKYHKLKYGTELNQGEMKMPIFESGRCSQEGQLQLFT